MATGPVPIEQLTNVPQPYAPLTEAQRYTYVSPIQPWENNYALQVARDSFEQMSRWRQQAGHDNRFYEADVTLSGWRPKKFWEGTRKPRAAIPVTLLLSQLESLLPNVMQNIFPLRENVEVSPRPGSTMQSANMAYELLMAQLDTLGEDGLLRFRDVAAELFGQGFLYGNGVCEVSWLYKQLPRITYFVDWEVPRAPTLDAVSGGSFMAPSGPPRRIVRERVQQIMWNQPHVQCIDIRDCYADPNARTPRIQDPSMRAFATRHFPTVGELMQFANQPYFMVPHPSVLLTMADQKTSEAADQSKRQSAALFGHTWNPLEDYTSDPYQRRVELIRWYTRERCIWILNRNWCFYNRINPYGVIPFLNTFYVPFPNRWHGMSLADVTEGDQHIIASLLEGRMDDLSLALNAPMVRRFGSMLQGTQLFVHPGKVWDVNDEPSKSLVRADLSNGEATQQAAMEVNDAYARSARSTGLSDMAVMGVPQAGGNSANRTAAGISAQSAAVGARIQYLVENQESCFIEPLLSMLHQFNVKFLPRNQLIPIIGADNQPQDLDPIHVLNANPRFVLRASSRMRSRSQLLQILPWFVQTLMNPELLQMMEEQQGQVLDVQGTLDFIADTLNTPKFALFRKLTPQELQQRQQQRQQPSPDALMKMQMQQSRLAAQGEMQQDAGDTDLLRALLTKLITPRAAEDVMGFDDAELIRAAAKRRPNGKGAGQSSSSSGSLM